MARERATEPLILYAFTIAGHGLERLHFPYDRQYNDVVEEVKQFILLTDQLHFLRLSGQMATFLVDLEKAHEDTPDAFKQQRFGSSIYGEYLPDEYRNRISQIVRDFFELLKKDGRSWEVVQIDRSAVSDVLRGLRSHAADQHQANLVDEAIRCLECGAYRAAIVTGWNLAFDHFRQWIFSSRKKRLKELNAVLTSKNRTPPQVVHYEDFFELSERVLIDDSYAAKLFKKGPHKFLVNALDTRNSFAHPSHLVATGVSAAGYIDGLIRNVITNPHFAYKARAVR